MQKYTLKGLVNASKNPSSQIMTQASLHAYIRECSQVLNEEKGYLLFRFQGRKMALLSDEKHNRMRIISPITAYSKLAPKIKDNLMQANFHSTLDARYAVSEDTLYACFIHPLSSLCEDELNSALEQVANLVKSFGKTYSSGQLSFTHKK